MIRLERLPFGGYRQNWPPTECVYGERVNVYLPDQLAVRARAAGVNISGLTQDAIRRALASADTDRWLDRLDDLPRADVAPQTVIDAVHAARDELGA